MSKRPSFSEKIGKYIGYLYSSSDNNNNSVNNNNSQNMAHPGPNQGQYQYGHNNNNNNGYQNNKNNGNNNAQNNYNRNRNNYNNNNNQRNNNNKNKKEQTYDTKNFDKIDYIVQIPLIDNPNDRQTRFLLAMDYTLPPRSGLGIMDTALEHMLHYYDMKKVELIFCEMWQSVCLFIEFHDIPSSIHAYNQLFQFFKTIFYVEDLSNLEEMWICAHCKHYNQFQDNFRGKMNSINDMASKRKNKQGDEYIYYCARCKNLNVPSYKKIKYSYQKQQLMNINHPKKSNRDQIGSISRVRQHSDPSNNANINGNSHSVSPPPRYNNTQPTNNNNGNYVGKHRKPNWHNAKSQPIARPPISKESAISAQMNPHDTDVIFPAGHLGQFQPYKKKPTGGNVINNNMNNNSVDIKSDDEDDSDNPLRTPGTHLMMGQAVGKIKFNNIGMGGNQHAHSDRNLHVLMPSKSLNEINNKENDNRMNNHYRHGSGGSARTGHSSSPEIASPQSSVSIQPASTPPRGDIPFGLNKHGKKYSVDSQQSQISLTSTTSTVSVVDNSLDLCLNIIENIDLNPLSASNPALNGSTSSNSSANRSYIKSEDLQQLDKQKQVVVDKIAKLTSMLYKIQNTFTSAIDTQKRSMDIDFNEVKQEENNPVYRNVLNDNMNNNGNGSSNNRVTAGGPVNNVNNMNHNGNVLTSQNVNFLQENTFLFSDHEDINNVPRSPQYNDVDNESNSHHTITAGGNLTDHTNDNDNLSQIANHSQDTDNDALSIRTPAGQMGQVLMGQANGPVPFKLPPPSNHNQKHNHNHSQYNQ